MTRPGKSVRESQDPGAASYRIGPPPPPETMELQMDADAAGTSESRSLTGSPDASRTVYGKIQNLTGETISSRKLTLALRYDTKRLIVTPDFNNTKPFDLGSGEVSPTVRLYTVAAYRPDKVGRVYPISATIYDTQGRYSNTVTVRAKAKPEKKNKSIFTWLLLLLVGTLLVLNRPRRRRKPPREEADGYDPNEEQSQP